jgi:CPA2 family monovalent cation:H+ antiporter-2
MVCLTSPELWPLTSVRRPRKQVMVMETTASSPHFSFFAEALILLGGAVLTAPLFKKIGLGTVLGYLVAGIVIGPLARLITDGDEILDFAELGVVFLLFVIGLELKPSRLWSLRRDIFGLGLAQVATTGVALCGLAVIIAGTNWAAGLIIGFGLALSSTAFALQILEDSGSTSRRYGHLSFAILLFQDLAIVPLLAIIPLLSAYAPESQASPLLNFAIAIAAVATLILAGRYLLNPLFRVIANTGAREAMIAAALLVVLGSAMLMHAAGLSMAMGSFLAGVMLAESSYRHELEADIEPFRGILLGLFFIGVGLSLNLSVIADNWLLIMVSVPLLMAVKTVFTYLLCRAFGNDHDVAVRAAFLLPQGGEFGFVLFTAAAVAGIFSESTASLLIAVVTLSMALTPVSVFLGEFFINLEHEEQIEEDFAGAGSDVLMIGFSRFCQIAAQILLSGGRDVTVIESSAERVRNVEKFGFRIYFGDGTRRDVLEAAGIRRAKIVAVCTNRRETTDRIVDMIQSSFPHTKLYVRSYDRTHTLDLRAKGVDYELRETFESGLAFGRRALEGLGVDEGTSSEIMDDVRRRDEERLAIQAVEGIHAGRDKLRFRPVNPEPLIKPSRESRRLDRQDGQPGFEPHI